MDITTYTGRSPRRGWRMPPLMWWVAIVCVGIAPAAEAQPVVPTDGQVLVVGQSE